MKDTINAIKAIQFKTWHIVFLSVILEIILFYLYYIPETKILIGDEKRYFRYAKAVLNGDGWYFSPTWPPLQHITLSFFLKFSNGSFIPFQIFQYLLLVISGFIVKNIVLRETGDLNSANLSLALMLLYPSWLAYSLYLWPEVIHVFLFVSVIWIFNYKYYNNYWLAIGFSFIGLMLLYKGYIVLFIPVFFIPLFRSLKFKQALLKSVAGICLTIIIITPATLKSHEMSGNFMPSNSSIYNLWLGINDKKRTLIVRKKSDKRENTAKAHPNYIQSAETYQERNAILLNKILKHVEKHGIFSVVKNQLSKQYFRLFDYKSTFYMQFLKAFPTVKKNPLIDSLLIYNTIIYSISIFALFLGGIVFWKYSSVSFQFVLFVIYVLGLFLLLHTIPRFRIPLVPVSAFYLGLLFYQFKHLNTYGNINIKRLMTLMGLFVLSLTILFFLFGGSYLDQKFPIN